MAKTKSLDAQAWRLVRDLAEVYTLDSDQIALIRLVQVAKFLLAARVIEET